MPIKATIMWVFYIVRVFFFAVAAAGSGFTAGAEITAKFIKNGSSLSAYQQAVEKNAIFNCKTGNTDPGKTDLLTKIPGHSSLTKYKDILLPFSTINLSQPWKRPPVIQVNAVTFPILYPIIINAVKLAIIRQDYFEQTTRPVIVKTVVNDYSM